MHDVTPSGDRSTLVKRNHFWTIPVNQRVALAAPRRQPRQHGHQRSSFRQSTQTHFGGGREQNDHKKGAGKYVEPRILDISAINFSNRLPSPFPLFTGLMQGHAESPEAMETLGREASAGVKPGSVIALVGGLGAGKTHWTKGFVAGAGSTAEVTSPTFGLVHEYPGGRLPIFHLDFYRLESAAELVALGWDEYLEQGGVVIAEWGNKFPELFPPDTIWLSFTVEQDGSRIIHQGAS